jgi:hypothetical protein
MKKKNNFAQNPSAMVCGVCSVVWFLALIDLMMMMNLFFR